MPPLRHNPAPATSTAFAACAAPAVAMTAALALLAGPPARGEIAIIDDEPGLFIDISATGTPLNLAGEQVAVIVTNISNALFPAGLAIIANNGGVGFSDADPFLEPTNQPIPSMDAFGGGQSLLAFWDDIGNTIGDVYFQEFNDRLVVQWETKMFEDDTDTATFQVQVLDESALTPRQVPIYAQMIYTDIEQPRAGGGASATIGYQDIRARGDRSVQWSFNTPNAVSNGTILSVVDLPPPACSGDLDGDLDTDFDDFSLLVACWNTSCGDLNGDLLTDFDDFNVLVSDWSCGN